MDLERFVTASDRTHDAALTELRAGRKTSHWMWWEFPQLLLGNSPTSVAYAVADLDEARAYLAHPVLGERLRENCRAVLACGSPDAEAILGPVDAVKLRSSMTLFAAADPSEELFTKVLEEFFDGVPDRSTTERL